VTFRDILRSLLRRWYVLAVALVCIAVAILALTRVDGVYAVRVKLVLLPPTIETADENILRGNSESLVHFAALIERSYNGNAEQPQFASVDAPMYASGRTSGVKVFLPNAGGQWSADFREAKLVVEAVDPSAEQVEKRLNATVAEIRELALQLQRAQGVDDAHLVSVLVSEETTGIQFVQGSKVRAAGGILILGLAIGVVATVLLDRAITRKLRSNSSR
jgi:hypothetical protein